MLLHLKHVSVDKVNPKTNQWPFQEPKLEVPTIYKVYFSGLNFREYPPKIWSEKWYVYVPPSLNKPYPTFQEVYHLVN
jgi:hypothetical protein